MPSFLTAARLHTFLPALPDPAAWIAAPNPAMDRFTIATRPHAAAFLAQVAHESGGFTRFLENLNYSAKRLMAVWPARFPTLKAANALRPAARETGELCVRQADGQRRCRFRGWNDDDDDADFVRISIRNGGRNGLAERRAYWARAKEALG